VRSRVPACDPRDVPGARMPAPGHVPLTDGHSDGRAAPAPARLLALPRRRVRQEGAVSPEGCALLPKILIDSGARPWSCSFLSEEVEHSA